MNYGGLFDPENKKEKINKQRRIIVQNYASAISPGAAAAEAKTSHVDKWSSSPQATHLTSGWARPWTQAQDLPGARSSPLKQQLFQHKMFGL